MHYEIATLTLPFGSAAQAAANVKAFSQSPEAGGELLGCWFSDVGPLNQMILLRGYTDAAALDEGRERTRRSADPFGCGAILVQMQLDSYRGFPWMEAARPSAESGISGPVYEIRTYGIKPGGVQPTIDLWQEYLPPRHRRSPCVAAMVALDGPLRFTNIWAYRSLDERSTIRAQAVADGIWPPKGGPGWLTTTMSSTIGLPTAVSPMK